MPRTKKKNQPLETATPSAMANGPTGEVFTLAEAAEYLRLSEREVVQMIHEQGLPARPTGKDWRFLKTAIQEWLSVDCASLQANKDLWLAMAGKYQDDPDLEGIVEDAMRRRGRARVEEDSAR